VFQSAGDTANPDELKDDLEKYEHLQELAIFPGETVPPSGTGQRTGSSGEGN